MLVVELLSVLAVAGLVVVHLFSGRLHFLDGSPRSVWLSIAGGVSVAYVFVHLLPELGESQETVSEAIGGGALAFVENHVYLVSLFGLASFYGLERAARVSRLRGRRRAGRVDATGGEDAAGRGVFWLHLASFTVYNAVIGYLLLHRIDSGVVAFLFFSLAMALHFFVNDFALREHHKSAYQRLGRWVLAAAIVFGWGLGLFTEVSELFIAVLIAFISGGVVLNVLKEEIPEERESRFWAFAAGAAAYAALLLTF